MAIILKDGVRFSPLRGEIYSIFQTLEEVFAECAPSAQVVITSANDSVHSVKSLHYTGFAIDVRSKNLSPVEKHAVLAKLKSLLDKNYDIILESEGKTNEHFHIEYDPK